MKIQQRSPESRGDDPLLRLMSLNKFGDSVGLHRVLFLMRALSRPAWFAQLDAIKVTGSKGKGSVSVVIAEILSHLKIETGLYTSPHLVHFRERIRVGSKEIDDAELSNALDWVLDLKNQYEHRYPADHIGAFEVFTAAALYHFNSHKVATAVLEAGIGGRYDSTRVVPGRIVALTSVEMEHRHLLGSSLDMIAYDKSDLCSTGGLLVLGQIDPDVLRRLRGYCEVRKVEILDAMEYTSIRNIRFDSDIMRFDISAAEMTFSDLSTRLLGEHQARNIAVALLTAWRWLALNRPEITEAQFKEAVRSALLSVRWKGRLQRISADPEVIIDVGHTPQSLRAVADTMKAMNRQKPILLVTGVSEDKDVNGILAEIVPIADSVVCTRAYHKGSPTSVIRIACEKIKKKIVWRCAETIGEAMDIATHRGRSENMTVLVAGGLFLAVEAMVYLQKSDPEKLRFF